MSRLSSFVVILFVLITFAEAEVFARDPGIIEEEDLGQLIVITPMDQGGQERRGQLREVDIRQLVAIDTKALIDVTEMVQSKAVDAITDAGLKVADITYDYSNTVPVGSVIRQEPQAGTLVEPNQAVKLVIAQTEIAIQPFPIQRDMTGRVEGMGQLVVHRLFDVELKQRLQHVPIFAIADEGLRHSSVQARAQSIAENLLMAWSILAEGGYLETATDDWIMPEDVEKWRLRGPFAPEYDDSVMVKNEQGWQRRGGKYSSADEVQHSFPAIYVRHESLPHTPLRIITVYPEDAKLFGQPADESGAPALFNNGELAEYLVALIKAHYLMLADRSGQLDEFEQLEICRTRQGKIFKEICLRAREEAGAQNAGGQPSIADLRSALARVAASQRARLLTLAFNAPRDWRVRNAIR